MSSSSQATIGARTDRTGRSSGPAAGGPFLAIDVLLGRIHRGQDDATPTRDTSPTAKHTQGYLIVQNPDGSFSLATPSGFTHPTEPTAHPVEHVWPGLPAAIDVDDRVQFTATELLDTMADTRARLAADRPERDDLWLENNDPVWARLTERISA